MSVFHLWLDHSPVRKQNRSGWDWDTEITDLVISLGIVTGNPQALDYCSAAAEAALYILNIRSSRYHHRQNLHLFSGRMLLFP